MTLKIRCDENVAGLPVMQVRRFLRRVSAWHGRCSRRFDLRFSQRLDFVLG